MNRTIEAVKNGSQVKEEELFDIVNLYECTHLMVMRGSQAITEMLVNKFEKYKDVYEFSQKCDVNYQYIIKKDDIISCATEWDKNEDTLFINCQLKDELMIQLMVSFFGSSCNKTASDDFHEIDIYQIKEFLEDVLNKQNEWRIFMAGITDAFGLDLKLYNPFRTYINTLEEEWKLNIGDDTSVLQVPIVDDDINLFYMKETDIVKEIIVKPYGHSFMEIKLQFLKNK